MNPIDIDRMVGFWIKDVPYYFVKVGEGDDWTAYGREYSLSPSQQAIRIAMGKIQASCSDEHVKQYFQVRMWADRGAPKWYAEGRLASRNPVTATFAIVEQFAPRKPKKPANSPITFTKMTSTITITFGDQVENHVGMQKIGTLAEEGFTVDELKEIAEDLSDGSGTNVELVMMSTPGTDDEAACVLIVRDAVDTMIGHTGSTDELLEEMTHLSWDKKAKMYGRVVNKHARFNLCFADEGQEPDYAEGKGRIVAWKDVPELKYVREVMPRYFGDKSSGLYAEGNYYYDVNKCGIGYHGDTERRIVIAIRLGATMPLVYRWYKNGERVSEDVTRIVLNHGDMMIMSEKASGFDWKKKSIYTLRHAAGCEKFIQ